MGSDVFFRLFCCCFVSVFVAACCASNACFIGWYTTHKQIKTQRIDGEKFPNKYAMNAWRVLIAVGEFWIRSVILDWMRFLWAPWRRPVFINPQLRIHRGFYSLGSGRRDIFIRPACERDAPLIFSHFLLCFVIWPVPAPRRSNAHAAQITII